MDLMGEASGGTRVLAVRHISAGKPLLEPSNAINTTLLCESYSKRPDFFTYYEALHTYAWALWPCGLFVVIAVFVLYGLTLRMAVKRYSKDTLVNISVVLAIYPIVSLAAFLAILVPRARLLSEAIAQEIVMIAMYHLYRIIIAECGGKDQFIRRAGGSKLETRILPCCCWPCCILPQPQIQQSHLTMLGLLILQMPFIQGIIYIITLAIWAEDMELYIKSFTYIQVFIAASILTGVWGAIMCIKAADNIGVRLRSRFLAVQLALLIVKLQCGFAKTLPEMLTLPCVIALHPTVFVHMIQNSLMILEMFLLSIWAYYIYSSPPVKSVDPVPQVVVAVLDDSYGIDSKTGSDKSYR